MFKLCFLITAILFSLDSYAVDANPVMNNSKKIQQKQAEHKDPRFTVGIGAHSHSFYRGALLDSASAIAPVGFITFGNIIFAGLAVMYVDQIPSIGLIYNLGFNYFTDHGFKRPDNASFRQLRDETFDAWISLTKPVNKHLILTASYHNDVKENWGKYYTVGAKIPVVQFISLATELGYGDERANAYIYGAGSRSGLANLDVSLNYSAPILPENGVLGLEIKQTGKVQNENKTASYVRENDATISIGADVSWNF